MAADFTVARAAAAESTLTLADAAGRNNLAQRQRRVRDQPGLHGGFTAERTVAAESTLAISVEAARVLPAVIEVRPNRDQPDRGGRPKCALLDAGPRCGGVRSRCPDAGGGRVGGRVGHAATCSVARAAWAWDCLVRVVARGGRIGRAERCRPGAPSPCRRRSRRHGRGTWRPSPRFRPSPRSTIPQLDKMVERIEGLQDAASVARRDPWRSASRSRLGQSASVVRVKADGHRRVGRKRPGPAGRNPHQPVGKCRHLAGVHATGRGR